MFFKVLINKVLENNLKQLIGKMAVRVTGESMANSGGILS